MNKSRFESLSISEATDIEREECFYDAVEFLVENLPDGSRLVLGSDGGEPEDNLLCRDWKWVVKSINKAYKDGFKDGEKQGFVRGEQYGSSGGRGVGCRD
jgi:hypothetical protein